jgi:exopolysaccharide production protein ExoZ
MSAVGKINAIQGLRGIAALLVVVDHSLLRFSQLTNAHPAKSDHLSYVAESLGRHGVEIFFLISGFIMIVTSHEDFKKPHAATGFLWRRIIRIVPLYWLMTALVMAQILWQHHALSLSEAIKSLTFIPYENDAGSFQPLLRRGWTLNYEMFFYALFAVALTQRPRIGIAGLMILLVLLTVAGQMGLAGQCASAPCGLLGFYMQPIMLYFAGGMLLGQIRLYLQRSNRLRSLKFDNGLGLAILSTAVYAAYICFTGPSTATTVAGVLFGVLAGALCALLADNSGDGRMRTTLLLVGEASYSIYMTHSVFIDPASRLWTRAFGGHGMALYVIAMVVGTTLLGMLTFRCVEKPTLRLLKRRSPASVITHG